MDAFNWKKDFVGKDKALEARNNGASRKLITMTLDVEASMSRVMKPSCMTNSGRLWPFGRFCSSRGKIHGDGLCRTDYAVPGTRLDVGFWVTVAEVLVVLL